MMRLLFPAAAALAVAASAPAQGDDGFPNRPIARAEVMAGVRRHFAGVDANRDGIVSRAEFDAYRARIDSGRAPPEPSEGLASIGRIGARWFEKNDANGDGRVTWTEAEARPSELFDQIDSDHDGVISLSERRVAMMMLMMRGR